MLSLDKEPAAGRIIAILVLIIFIIDIVRVSTKYRSQVRREVEFLTLNKFQSAIIAAQNGESAASVDY